MTKFFASNFHYFLTFIRKLGVTATHCIQAGFTDFSIGLVRDEPVMIPVDILTSAGSRRLRREDYEW
jgi:hypothetical protein